MTEQDRLDEIMRMTERYKMDESRRRVPMLQAAEMGPGTIDEYAYLEGQQQPAEGAPGLPQFSARTNPYPAIQLPGVLAGGPDVGAEVKNLGGGRISGIPPGWAITDDPTVPIRDPSGDPARYSYPTLRQMISDYANAMQPGGPAGAALKGVAGAVHGADMVLGAGPTFRRKPPGLPPPAPGQRMGHNGGPPIEAPYPQYAERYPDIAPAETKIDPKKGPYPAKGSTPETKAFVKAREKIVDDMKEKGFEPYFDPAQRYDVDPSHYPPNLNTLDIQPAKPITAEKHMKVLGSDEARANLRAAAEQGQKIPEAEGFYKVGQLEKAFIDELGEVEGRKAFADKFAAGMSATTSGADPQTNLLMTMYLNYLQKHGKPLPEASWDMPPVIGGRRGMSNVEAFDRVMAEGGFAGLGRNNPKRHNFAQNFFGNKNVATMDEQMSSGAVPGMTVPPDNTYGLFEGVAHEEAAKLGMDPRTFQELGWAGFKQQKTPSYTRATPFIGEINEAIERTHRLTGMPRDEIVRRGFVRNEIPIYGSAGSPAELMRKMREQYEGDQNRQQ